MATSLIFERVIEVAERRSWVAPVTEPNLRSTPKNAILPDIMSTVTIYLRPQKDGKPWKEYNVRKPFILVWLVGSELRFEAGHGPVYIMSLSEKDIDEALDEVLEQVREEEGKEEGEEEGWW